MQQKHLIAMLFWNHYTRRSPSRLDIELIGL